MRYAYATGVSSRHAAFLRALGAERSAALVIRELTRPRPRPTALVEAYRESISRREEDLYGPPSAPDKGELVVAPGELGHDRVLSELRSAEPDVLLVFGTSILPPQVLAIPRLATLNVHTGITQLFRGVDSGFWAVHDGRPEGVGATVHHVDGTVDAGPVVAQARPRLTGTEDLAALFFASVELGWDLMMDAVRILAKGYAAAHPLPRRGKLYQLGDMTDEAVREADSRLRSVVAEYVGDRAARDAREPIFALSTTGEVD